MKNYTSFIYLIFISIGIFGFQKNGNAQLDTNDFVTTWQTDLPGRSNDSAIHINIDTNYSYNYNIDWNNDGLFDTIGVTTDFTIQFSKPDTYTIRISGDFPALAFGYGSPNGYNLNGDYRKIKRIEQWGNNQWKYMVEGLRECSNLTHAGDDVPNLDSVQSLSWLFSKSSIRSGALDQWDVSSINNMSGMFRYTPMNIDIGLWDVSNVTNMSGMFEYANHFNQDVGNWNVSNVTNMISLFRSTKLFNQPLNKWDVSSVGSMGRMFSYATSFNQPLNNWDVSNVVDMTSMFYNAHSFNNSIGNWDVSNVHTFDQMFNSAYQFNQDISNWNVSNAIWMVSMFKNAWHFNQDLSNWNTIRVRDLREMFRQAYRFNQNLASWPIDSVQMMDGIFINSNLSLTNYDSILIAWEAKPHLNFVSVISQREFCAGSNARDSLIADGWNMWGDQLNCSSDDFVMVWTTSNPGTSNDSAITIYTDSNYNYNYDIDWDNDGIFDTTGITTDFTIQFPQPNFYYIRISGDFPSIKFGQGDRDKLEAIWQWGSIAFKNVEHAFDSCSNLYLVDNKSPNLDSATSMDYMFRGAGYSYINFPFGLYWDVSTIQSMEGTFEGFNFFGIDAQIWDVSNVTNMKNMFKGFTNYWGTGLQFWNVKNVTNMSGMFNDARNFREYIGSWDVSKVTNMSYMFKDATSINQQLNSWDVSKVTDMSSMFANATSFNRAIDNWDVSSVTNMSGMFTGNNFNQPLDNWDVSNVTDMSEMFSGAQGFNQNLGMWYIDSVSSMIGMLDSSGMSVNNYDSTLIGWQGKSNPDSLTLGVDGLIYCLGEAARDSLINDGWSFVGDSKDTACIVTAIQKSLEGTVNLFKLYPNPTQGMLFIEIDQADQNTPLLIYNQVGQIVKEARLVNGRNQLDLTGQAKGVYFVRYGEVTEKVILTD